jgi:hypothetical protein
VAHRKYHGDPRKQEMTTALARLASHIAESKKVALLMTDAITHLGWEDITPKMRVLIAAMEHEGKAAEELMDAIKEKTGK